MAEIRLENVTLAYPMLGAGENRRIGAPGPAGAGAIVLDKKARGRSISALSDISLHFGDGDRVGLVGRNGSGKSTLLKVMGGVYQPMSGGVTVSGTVAALYSVGLGMRLDASGYVNIIIAGLMAGYEHKDILAMIPEIAEFSELGPYLDLPVRTYSNGMAMRLKFACGTAFQPDILLLDEWLGAGDPVFYQKAQRRMNELVSKAGILVLASHNHALIRGVCNKVVWLHEGHIKAVGPTAEVLPMAEASMFAPAPSSAPAAAAATTDGAALTRPAVPGAPVQGVTAEVAPIAIAADGS